MGTSDQLRHLSAGLVGWTFAGRTAARTRRLAGAVCLASVLLVAGCGKSGSSATTAEQTSTSPASGDTKIAALPPASISAPSSDAVPPGPATLTADAQSAPSQNAEPAAAPPPAKGSPEWLLGQMIALRAEPIPKGETPESHLRQRNEKLIEMAHQVIKNTFKDKSKQQLFDFAVQFLVESRVQMALGGNKDQARQLIEDAKALYARDPASPSAAEAAFGVVRVAAGNARRYGKSDSRHVQEFAVQARLFATQFSKQDMKAVQMLSAAAQLCERFGIETEAMTCFAMLQEKYPQTPQAEQAAAVLRRMHLKGRALKFGGETADGGFLKIEQFKGKPVLIVFWASDSEDFQEMLPQLKTAIRKYERAGLATIGVCLDDNEPAMESFIEKNGMNWKQIFYADQNKRRWENPVVQYFGVREIPAMWLVDAKGVVVDTHVSLDSLDSQIRYAVAAGPTRTRR